MYFNRYIKLFHAKLGLTLGFTAFSLASPLPTRSQIVPDRSLPVNSIVTPDANTSVITGGTRSNNNLFHSFSSFSIPTNSTAFFNNATDLKNIFARVTGSSISNINGLIKANGTANLFLINPNGILFGPNAQLNIGGSFLASTADSIVFSDRTQFSAKDPSTPPLLTVSVPIGLQFGPNPGNIVANGQGVSDPPTDDAQRLINFKQSVLDSPTGLGVKPEKTLALVGGDIMLSGGILKAKSGRIELGSVRGEGFVNLNLTDKGFVLEYKSIPSFGDIQLSQQSSVLASGLGGGDIQLFGKRITITNGSQVEASTLGSEAGGNLRVQASESVKLIGISPDENNPSLLGALTFATGKAGNLTIETGQLTLQDGAQIVVATLSQGQGGSVTIHAVESVKLIGNDSIIGGQALNSGNAGNVTIETGQLTLQDGAEISVGTRSQGQGGSLTIHAAESVKLIGNGSIIGGQASNSGNAGNVRIETGQLTLQDGAEISVGTLSQGQGGSLTIHAAESVKLIGNGSIIRGQASNSGNAGNVKIETGRLIVWDGSLISVSGSGEGNPGNLEITASQILLSNGRLEAFSETGKGGNITLRSPNIQLRDASIFAYGSSTGNGMLEGNIEINTQTIALLERSGIFTIANDPRGGSNLKISSFKGLDPVVFKSRNSIIFADGNLTITGAVNVSFSDLPEIKVMNVEGLISAGCTADRGSKFVITGRGGLPESPKDSLSGDVVWVDERSPVEANINPTSRVAEEAIVEASGWTKGPNGEVILTANPPRLYQSWLTPPDCHQSTQ